MPFQTTIKIDFEEAVGCAEKQSVARLLQAYAPRSGACFTLGKNASTLLTLGGKYTGHEYSMTRREFLAFLVMTGNHVEVTKKQTDLGSRYTVFVNMP